MDFIDLHARMIRDIFLRVEIMLNDGIDELAEYDIQAFMFLFFRRTLVNTGFQARRESNGKVDCVLIENQKPKAFYEIKTYFKENENIKRADFDGDIEKLQELAQKNPNSRCYFIVAGKKSKFKKLDKELKEFIDSHVFEDSKKWQEWEIKGVGTSRMRPGQKQKRGRSVVVSWEIKL